MVIIQECLALWLPIRTLHLILKAVPIYIYSRITSIWFVSKLESNETCHISLSHVPYPKWTYWNNINLTNWWPGLTNVWVLIETLCQKYKFRSDYISIHPYGVGICSLRGCYCYTYVTASLMSEGQGYILCNLVHSKLERTSNLILVLNHLCTYVLRILARVITEAARMFVGSWIYACCELVTMKYNQKRMRVLPIWNKPCIYL